MLRITVHNTPGDLTFQLEGMLAGPWVHELEKCWRNALASGPEANVRVDLTNVTFIDEAGKTCLAALFHLGAVFVAADCATKAIVGEIAEAAEQVRDGKAACPFDGQVLSLREVTVETPDDQPRSSLDVEPYAARMSEPRPEALEQAVKLRVIDRTGGRIQALTIELTDGELVVRGTAPCYYVKQLALQAALDVLRSACEIVVDVKLDIDVVPSARPGLG